MATTTVTESEFDEVDFQTTAAALELVKKATTERKETTVKETTIAKETTVKETTIARETTQESTTTTTTTQALTTTSTPSITTQAAKDETTKLTEAPIVEIPGKVTQPPYEIVTDTEVGLTTTNGTLPNDGGPTTSGASIGIIAGAVSGLILLVIIIIIVVILLRRRHKKKDKHIIRVENPSYGKPARDYRFSRDSSLYVGPTVDIQSFKPNNESPTSAKKKRSAPQPPTSSQKRAAPVPPNPFGDDNYYEKDSHGSIESLELSTFTARNDNSKMKDDSGVSEPLMKNDRNGNLHNDNSDEEEPENGDHSTFQQNSLGKSLDEYDKTRNPFFEK